MNRNQSDRHQCAWCNETFTHALDRDRHEERTHPDKWGAVERVNDGPARTLVVDRIEDTLPPLSDDSHPDEKSTRGDVLAEIANYANRGRAVLVHGYTFKRWCEALAEQPSPSVTNALAVLTRDPTIRAYLAQHDPKALEQADKALAGRTTCSCLLAGTDGWHARECPRRVAKGGS